MSQMSTATKTTTEAATSTATARIACPICGSGDISIVGRPLYRQPTKVAGVPIDLSDLDLTWRRCGACGYQFIYPGIPEERLLACYAGATTGHWGTADENYGAVRFYEQKKRVLEQFSPGKRIVDFGCFDGGFLAYLGAPYEKFGIEPSADAARVAQSRGVQIIGPTAAAAVQSGGPREFDAIVSFDVFEHLNDPVATLGDLKQLLRPGGIILIETGNTDTPIWRRAGARYPYSAYVDHVGLFNRSSIAEAGRRTGMSLVHFQSSAHHVNPLGHWIGARVLNSAHSVLRGIDAIKIPLPARLRQAARGPIPRSTAADHFLAVLRVD